jgi:hypothetical protein
VLIVEIRMAIGSLSSLSNPSLLSSSLDERPLNVNEAVPRKNRDASETETLETAAVGGAGSHRFDSVIRLSLTRRISSCPPIPV